MIKAGDLNKICRIEWQPDGATRNALNEKNKTWQTWKDSIPMGIKKQTPGRVQNEDVRPLSVHYTIWVMRYVLNNENGVPRKPMPGMRIVHTYFGEVYEIVDVQMIGNQEGFELITKYKH